MFADAEAYERFMRRWSRLEAPQLVDFSGVPDLGPGSSMLVQVSGALAFAVAERKPTGSCAQGSTHLRIRRTYANSR